MIGDGLRSGDVFAPDSRRYSDPVAYLLTPDEWVDQPSTGEFCQMVGKPTDPSVPWPLPPTSRAAALGELGEVLLSGTGQRVG